MSSLQQRIITTQTAIAGVENELASLHAEAKNLQRQAVVAPNSTQPSAIAKAARDAAAAEGEQAKQLKGIQAGVSALQSTLAGYQRQLSGLRLQEREIEQVKAEQEAKTELQKSGEHLARLSTEMEQAMLATHQAGTKINRLQGLGGTAKYSLAMTALPTFVWDRGAYYISSRQVDFRTAEEKKPLAVPYVGNTQQIQEQAEKREQRDRKLSRVNGLEITVAELHAEIADYKVKLNSYGNSPSGPAVKWAEDTRFVIQQRELELQKTKLTLSELKAEAGVPHAV